MVEQGRCRMLLQARMKMDWVGVVMVVAMLMMLGGAGGVGAQNVTEILAKHPNYSSLNRWLSATGVVQEINSRSSLTILCPDNAILDPVAAQNPNLDQMADVLRYHVMLQYLDTAELKTMNNGSGLVTTLYQTTGRVEGNNGFVNVTDMPNGAVQVGTAAGAMQAAILTNITQYPYNYSFFQVNAVLIPDGLASTPAATAANLTDVLVKAGKFQTLVGLLKSTGVDAALATRETGNGMVLFAPTDDAFAALPAGSLAKLTEAQKVAVLQYHVLTSYFPLGSLEKLSNPVAATLATPPSSTEYSLRITPLAANVDISSGLMNTTVTNTLYDQPPVAVFSIGSVLLPREIFAPGPAAAPVPLLAPSVAPTPAALVPSPLTSPALAPTLVPTPSISPSLVPTLAPFLAPTPVPVTSPPAPPATSPASSEGGLSPAATPETSPNGVNPMSCSRSLIALAIFAASVYLMI